MIAARNLVIELLDKKKPKDYASTVRLISGAYDSLVSLDRSFCLEKEMLDNGQELIDSAATLDFFDRLPSESKPLTLVHTQALLSSLRDQPSFAMASASLQRKFECVQEILYNMERAISPDPSIATGGPFYAKVLNKLALFMRCKDAKDNIITGKAVIDFEWNRIVKEMPNVPLMITLSDLEPFQCHKWLLTPEQSAELSTWVCKVLAKSQTSSNSKAATGSSSAASGARVGKLAKAAVKKEEKSCQGKAALIRYF